jgi:hypothetical protein
MRIEPECIPCTLAMSVAALRQLPVTSEQRRDIFAEGLQIPAFQRLSWDIRSPEIIEALWRIICSRLGKADPFREQKAAQNQRVSAILPFLRETVRKSERPLQTAVHLAVIGNAIDLMVDNHAEDIEETVRAGLKDPLPEDAFAAFFDKLGEAQKLVYLGDNCGEIVFDKLLMETIREQTDADISFVVRSVPIMNDVTRQEAEEMGVASVATVVENGIDGPVPGTLFDRCSPDTRELLRSADLILSKGGGNFDVLDQEAGRIGTDIAFLLLCKCHPYRRYFQRDLQLPVIWNSWTTT